MEKLIEALSANINLVRALIDNIPSPVYFKDKEGKYLLCNKAFNVYFGFPDAPFHNKKVFDLPIGHEEAQLHYDIDMELLKSPGIREYEAVSTVSGNTHHEMVRKATFCDADGSIVGIVGVITDITGLKSMEESIARSKNLQSLGTLAGGIAHDFNNLLMAIVGNLSLARMNTDENSRAVEYLNEAERIVFLGKSLTQQLLAFSRGGDPVRTIIDAGSLARKAANKVMHASQVRCIFDIPADIFLVEADEDQIMQVMENVLLNAREATQKGGKVTVRMENVAISPEDMLALLKEDYVKISITDEGSGIDPESLSRIFDPYYTTKGMGSQKGVGLGLAISFAIIKKHNGNIVAESSKGQGTTFHIYLPAYKRSVVEDNPGKKNTSGGRKRRVLLLDDEEMILRIGEELLVHLGYEVTPARSGAETVSLYRQAMELQRPFDVVILDLIVPGGIGGREVCRELMRIDPLVKAIVSSGHLNNSAIVQYRAYGFLDVLTKPYDLGELEEKLRRIIETG